MASVIFTTSVIGTRRPATLTNGTSSSSSSSSDVSSSTPKKDYCKKKKKLNFNILNHMIVYFTLICLFLLIFLFCFNDNFL